MSWQKSSQDSGLANIIETVPPELAWLANSDSFALLSNPRNVMSRSEFCPMKQLL